MATEMEIAEQVVDIFFVLFVLGSSCALIAYIILGHICCRELKAEDTELWKVLGKPMGVYTLTFHSSGLITDFIGPEKYTSHPHLNVRKYGSLIALSNKLFRLLSIGCLLSLITLLMLKGGYK